MPTSMENKIFANLKTILSELTWIKYIEYEKIRNTQSEFQDFELPAVQIYDLIESYSHVTSRVETSWQIIVELIQKANPDGTHNQAVLMDRKYEIERKIGENVKLNIQSVAEDGRIKHVKYIQSQTSLFLIDGLSLAQLQFEVLFEKPFTGIC